jgi:hypothetical protein
MAAKTAPAVANAPSAIRSRPLSRGKRRARAEQACAQHRADPCSQEDDAERSPARARAGRGHSRITSEEIAAFAAASRTMPMRSAGRLEPAKPTSTSPAPKLPIRYQSARLRPRPSLTVRREISTAPAAEPRTGMSSGEPGHGAAAGEPLPEQGAGASARGEAGRRDQRRERQQEQHRTPRRGFWVRVPEGASVSGGGIVPLSLLPGGAAARGGPVDVGRLGHPASLLSGDLPSRRASQSARKGTRSTWTCRPVSTRR